MEKELLEIYKQWCGELKTKCSTLLSDEYSNPYIVCIPEEWNDAEHRVMIVGEEGRGAGGCLKDEGCTVDNAEELQRFNYEILTSQTNRAKVDKYKTINSCFWRRFRKIYKLGYPCIWNNIDKIHIREKRKNSYRLNKEERILLHSTEIKILEEEINILKPDTVVFFGWYGESLRRELPEIYEKLYPDDKDYLWKNSFYKITQNDINYVFTYHPSWRGKYKPADYEKNVLECIKNCLQ